MLFQHLLYSFFIFRFLMFQNIHFNYYDFVEKIYDIKYIEFFFEFVDKYIDKIKVHFRKFDEIS